MPVINCYSTCDVSGGTWAGGFVGLVYEYGINYAITNCFSVGEVTGTNQKGGFIGGFHYDSFGGGFSANDCFWDTEISGLNNAINSGSFAGVTGKTTAEMKKMFI